VLQQHPREGFAVAARLTTSVRHAPEYREEFGWRNLEKVAPSSRPHFYLGRSRKPEDLTLRRAIAQLVLLFDLARAEHCS